MMSEHERAENERLRRVTRELASMLKSARSPDNLIGQCADTYPYKKAEVLATAERVLEGAPEPTKGNCGHCAQPYGSRAEIERLRKRLEAVGKYADQCAILRVEPSTAGLREALAAGEDDE
jgi:hypothetical protein